MEEEEKGYLADLFNSLIADKHKHQKAIKAIDMVLDSIREELNISVRVSFIIEV